MNKELNSAIAFLEGKGFEVLKPSEKAITYIIVWDEVIVSEETLAINQREAFGGESDILALAKSAGWTGEEWEPKEDLCYAVCKEIREHFSHFSEWDLPIGFEDRLNAALAKAEGGS